MIPTSASAYFWDVDPRKLDTRTHERFIISRLLNYGGLEEWRWLAKTYGSARLSTVLRSTARLGLREPARRLAVLMFD